MSTVKTVRRQDPARTLSGLCQDSVRTLSGLCQDCQDSCGSSTNQVSYGILLLELFCLNTFVGYGWDSPSGSDCGFRRQKRKENSFPRRPLPDIHKEAPFTAQL